MVISAFLGAAKSDYQLAAEFVDIKIMNKLYVINYLDVFHLRQ